MLLNSTKIPGNMGEKGPGRSPRDRAALNTSAWRIFKLIPEKQFIFRLKHTLLITQALVTELLICT